MNRRLETKFLLAALAYMGLLVFIVFGPDCEVLLLIPGLGIVLLTWLLGRDFPSVHQKIGRLTFKFVEFDLTASRILVALGWGLVLLWLASRVSGSCGWTTSARAFIASLVGSGS